MKISKITKLLALAVLVAPSVGLAGGVADGVPLVVDSINVPGGNVVLDDPDGIIVNQGINVSADNVQFGAGRLSNLPSRINYTGCGGVCFTADVTRNYAEIPAQSMFLAGPIENTSVKLPNIDTLTAKTAAIKFQEPKMPNIFAKMEPKSGDYDKLASVNLRGVEDAAKLSFDANGNMKLGVE